ncbi:MAG: N-acetyl-alpha-D-glucosaminyl L-malate synthase BshA [Cytophagales bacterium]|nr:N-acetyl-alpha-D-glucosaminyl L-malate synthase BshA [Cytophagales bacterium]MDW8383906.1 N-acetyl-alpha-D-glucosaminyl L-malate synthase BshA [Flammeovirgaceae bacterium]
MKIGIVCYPTYGGSGVVATELGKGLAYKGYDVHFITYSAPTRLDLFSENIHFHQVNIQKYPLFEYAPYELALTGKMVNVVKTEHLDLLHVHYAIPHASAAIAARQILATERIYIPVITTLHGTDISLVGKDESFAPVVAFSINQSDGVTAVSRYLQAETYQHFPISKHIEIIPNFVNLQRFKKLPKEHFKRAIAPHGEKLLVHASNFRKVKRIQDVIKIFALVKQEIAAKLLLVGDGPERAKAEHLCHEYKLYDDVRFLGKIEAIEEVYSIADLFLMPSETESFGLAALEAMACEVPIISSNAGGLPELNVQGVTGFMSDVGNIEEMAAQAIYVLDDANLPIFKKNALMHAQKFDMNLILPKYESFYKKVLELSKKVEKI